ncbi:MAG: hypothetical protein HC821_05610, partial [Lewinella sp.]|nr:hypothetical protein [Lewinella sp.]
ENLALDLDNISMSAEQLSGFQRIVQDGLATQGELDLSRSGSAVTDVLDLTTLIVNIVGDFANPYDLTFTTSGAVKTDITVEGGNDGDTITTGDGDDTITGFDGADELDGMGGLDTLDGGAGADHLLAGSATTSYTSISTTLPAASWTVALVAT